jgi:hypothetical protein
VRDEGNGKGKGDGEMPGGGRAAAKQEARPFDCAQDAKTAQGVGILRQFLCRS